MMRGVNREAIMRLVRHKPGVSRTHLASLTGLSKATISDLVNELIAAGWMAEHDFTGETHRGRAPRPLALDSTHRRLLGCQINEASSVVMAIALTGEVTELAVSHLRDGSVTAAFDTLGKQIGEMHLKLKRQGLIVSGIGLAVPGPVDPSGEVLLFSDGSGWKNLPVRDMLQLRLSKLGLSALPVLISRAINCVAQYHLNALGIADDDPLLYIHVGKSIASSFFFDGQPLVGLNGRAGVISHVKVDPQGNMCACGRRGCACVTLTLSAMERRSGWHGRSLRDRYAEDDENVVSVVNDVARQLAALIHDICLAHDPARLLVGGEAFRLGAKFHDGVQTQLEVLSRNSHRKFPDMVVTPVDDHAAAHGAAALVMNASRHGSLYET